MCHSISQRPRRSNESASKAESARTGLRWGNRTKEIASVNRFRDESSVYFFSFKSLCFVFISLHLVPFLFSYFDDTRAQRTAQAEAQKKTTSFSSPSTKKNNNQELKIVCWRFPETPERRERYILFQVHILSHGAKYCHYDIGFAFYISHSSSTLSYPIKPLLMIISV